MKREELKVIGLTDEAVEKIAEKNMIKKMRVRCL